MSIASQITRLQNIKTAIRQALVNKGITAASTHDMDDFATDISNIPSGGTYQSKSVSPSTSSQTVTPDSGYDALSSVTVNAVSLQSKSQTITPDANWSGSTTAAKSITPDSGYLGMSSVAVSTPMCRDYMLMTANGTETPSTVYSGDTSQSNSQKLLKMAPTKTGMVYTGSYLYLQPNSYLGNATASDVASGKTFSSSNGIQITGTGSSGTTSPLYVYLYNIGNVGSTAQWNGNQFTVSYSEITALGYNAIQISYIPGGTVYYGVGSSMSYFPYSGNVLSTSSYTLFSSMSFTSGYLKLTFVYDTTSSNTYCKLAFLKK